MPSLFRRANNIQDYVTKELERAARASAGDRRNAIEADGMQCIWYSKTSVGRFCSCQARHDEETDIPFTSATSDRPLIEIGKAFGESFTQIDTIEQPYPYAENADAVGQTRISYDIADGVACAICFRTGFESGYQLAHGTRYVLTAQTAYLGPDTDTRVATPLEIVQHCPTRPLYLGPSAVPRFLSYAKWTIEVPYVWDSLRVGVYLNERPVSDGQIWMETGGYWWHLTDSDSWLPEQPGIEANIYVVASQFTHCILEFENLADRPYVSFPQLSISKSFTDFEGISSLTLEVSGQQISMVRPSDLLFVPTIKKVLTVNGAVNRLLTPKKQTPVGWSTEARVIQPVELQTVLQEMWTVKNAPFPL